MANAGDVIGNYRLLEELASGSFGTIYKGVHIHLSSRIVAVKIMHTHLQTQEERDSFFHEASLLETLDHPHILPLFDVGCEGKTPYLVTVYAPGGSLRHHLHRQNGKLLSFEESLTILDQVTHALAYAHRQNIVHRDLKPDNILFDANQQILLADFGIASILGSRSFHLTNPYGTPGYMAPEQFRGEVSRESDQYALGCIAYELFTGQKPFTAPDVIALGFKHLTEQVFPPRLRNPLIPEHIDQAILRALAKDRKARFPDVLTFASALRIFPKSSQQWVKEGKALLRLKKYGEARAVYEQVIHLDPNSADAYVGKGHALQLLNQFTEALTAYEQAIRLDPNSADAYVGKGDALRLLDRFIEALTAYEQAIRLDPNFADAYVGKGDALRLLNRFIEALTAYEQAIYLDPNSADAYTGKGHAFRGLNQFTEALTAYEQAICLDLNSADAYAGKGHAFRGLNQFTEALTAYEQAIYLDPNSADAYAGKGHAFRSLNKSQEAQKAYQKAQELLYR